MTQKAGMPIEVCAFIGSSYIRQYAEDWTLDRMLQNTREALTFAQKHNLPVMYVTEDTTRARPETIEALYGTAIKTRNHNDICDEQMKRPGSKILTIEKEFGKWFETEFFRIRCYKKGTMHFEFKTDDVWGRFNQRVAKIKGYPLMEKKEQTKYQDRQNGRKAPIVNKRIFARDSLVDGDQHFFLARNSCSRWRS